MRGWVAFGRRSQIAASRMSRAPTIRTRRPSKRDTERAHRASSVPRSKAGDRRRLTPAENLPDMAGKNRWRPARYFIDLPGGGRREQTEDEAWNDARALVGQLMALGLPQTTIVTLMRPKMDPATLRKHFAAELAMGRQYQEARVAKTAYQMAVSGRNPAMTRFWLHTRAGWRSSGAVEERCSIEIASIPGDDGL